MYQYGPPETDSEDEYEGFSFGDDDDKPRGRPLWRADSEEDLRNAITAGNLDNVIKLLSTKKLDINAPIRGGYTLLHHACKNGHIDLVKYLLQNGAKVNRQVDSVTPLMEACACVGDSKVARDIVALLLENGAMINISTKIGMTPFMYACIQGHVEVTKLLIKEVYLEAFDNQGWTAIFHAIENNQPKIVEILVAAGAEVNISNNKGYTPRQVAQFHGFDDILQILPPEEYQYFVPTTYISYSSLRDYIPRLFLKSDVPEYFPEIDNILCHMRMQSFLKFFAQNHISLSEFLTITDEKLENIGILLPLHRKKILLGLLRYHLNHWKTKEIVRVKRKDEDSFYDILMLAANQLKHLIIINSAIKFVIQNIERGEFGDVSSRQIHEFRQTIKAYREVLSKLKSTTKYLQSFSPKKPPLYVDYNEYVAEKKRGNIRKYVKYSIFIGVSLIVCFKMNRIF